MDPLARLLKYTLFYVWKKSNKALKLHITVVVGAILTVNIGLGSSVIEILTRVTGVLGSIPGPVI